MAQATPTASTSLTAKSAKSTTAGIESVLSHLANCFSDVQLVVPSSRDVANSYSAPELDAGTEASTDPVVRGLNEIPFDVIQYLVTSVKLPLVCLRTDDVAGMATSPPSPAQAISGSVSHGTKKNKEAATSHASQGSPFVPFPSLPSKTQRLYSQHVRELSVLAAVLARPRETYRWNLNYDHVLRVLCERHLCQCLVEHVEATWKAVSTCETEAGTMWLTRLLLLYCDLLLMFQEHVGPSRGVVEEIIPADLVECVWRVVTAMSETAARQPLDLQRCYLELACFAACNVSVLAPSVIAEAAARVVPRQVARSSPSLQQQIKRERFTRFADLPIIAFVSAALSPGDAPKEVVDARQGVLPAAFEVARCATVYDFDVAFLYRRDGALSAPLLLVKSVLSRLFASLWNHMTADAWEQCTMETRVRSAKAMSMYAFLWQTAPAGTWTLLQWARERLQCATGAKTSDDSHADSAPRTDYGRITALVGQVLGENGSSGTYSGAGDEENSGEAPNDDGGAPANEFRTSSVNTVVVVHCFCSAALCYGCTSVAEVRDVIQWQATPPSGAATPTPTAAVGNQADGAANVGQLPLATTAPVPSSTSVAALDNALTWSLDYLKATAMAPDVVRVLHNPPAEKERSTLFNAAFSLLHAVLCTFPLELGRLGEVAQQSLLDVAVSVFRAVLHVQWIAPDVQEMTYNLIERYHTAMGSVAVLGECLLLPRTLAAVGTRLDATGSAFLQVHLYATLCGSDETESLSPRRLLTLLCDVQPDVLGSGPDGTVLFVRAVYALCELLQGSLSAETIGGPLLTEFGVDIDVLVQRLCEGLAGVFREWSSGQPTVCGVATTVDALELALHLLAEVLSSNEAFVLLNACLVPSETAAHAVVGSDGGSPLPAPFLVLSILIEENLPLAVYRAAAELVGAWLQRGGTLFHALRSSTPAPQRMWLSARLHAVLKSGIGSTANPYRLEVLRLILFTDAAAFHYLTGPDSLAANAEAVELTDLVITKVLCDIVLHNEAGYLEKAPALEVLRGVGAAAALSLSRVVSLLNDLKEGSTPPYETLGLAAAATRFINSVLCDQMSTEERESKAGAAAAQPLSPGSGQKQLSISPPRTSANAAGSATRGSKVMSTNSDAVDTVLRRGCAFLARVRCYYEELSRRVWYARGDVGDADLTTTTTSFAAGLLPTEGGGGTALSTIGTSVRVLTAGGGGAADGRFSHSRTALLSKSLWEHVHLRPRRTATGTSPGELSRSVFHTDVLSPSPSDEERRYRRLCPMVLGETYTYMGTGDDARLNVLGSALDGMQSLLKALETTVWFTARDAEANTLFSQRSLAVFETGLECAVLCQPVAPLLCRPVTHCAQAALALVTALAQVMEAGYQFSPINQNVPTSLQRLLHRVVHVAEGNTGSVLIAARCVRVVAAVKQSSATALGVLERAFVCVSNVLVQHLYDDVSATMDDFLDACVLLFVRNGALCPISVLTTLVPSLFQRATVVSHRIVATAPADVYTSHFLRVLLTLRTILAHCTDAAVACFLPCAEVTAMVGALSNFRLSACASAALPRGHQRQAWHVAWVGLLELAHAILVSGAGDGPYSASATGWLAALPPLLMSSPRFLLALGGFTELPAADRRLFVWDVQEMQLCTQLVATIAALGHPLPTILQHVQRSFCQAYRFRLMRYCVTSSAAPDVAAAEGRVIETALVRVARDQLSYLLLQPVHGAAPVSAAGTAVDGGVDGPMTCGSRPAVVFAASLAAQAVASVGEGEVKGGLPSAVRSSGNAAVTDFGPSTPTYDLLRRFVVQELQILRRINVLSGTDEPRSPEGPTIRLSTSRESSMTRSPSLGRADTDVMSDSATDDARTAAPELHRDLHREFHTLHTDSTQLVLHLFTLAAEEVVLTASRRQGQLPATPYQRELRETTEKLLHALDSVRGNLRRMESPKLSTLVDLLRHRLKSVLAALQV